MDNKKNIFDTDKQIEKAAKGFWLAFFSIIQWIIVALILTKLWVVVAAVASLPIFGFWFWLGAVYVVKYLLKGCR